MGKRVPPAAIRSTEKLNDVIRIQSEIEVLKKAAHMFDEPYLSETSRELDARNNRIMGQLIEAGWHLQGAQCALETNVKAVYPPCPDAQVSRFFQSVGGHGGYTAVELSR